MKRILLCILCMLTFVGCAHFCRGASPIPELTVSMKSKYASVKSLSADFTQRLTHQESGAVDVRKGTLTFQSPMRIRWETTAPNPELLLSTEKEVWSYNPADKTASRFAPEIAKESHTILQVLTGQTRLDKDYDVTESGREDGLIVLHIYPHEPTMQVAEGRVWVDAETHFVRQVEIVDFYGNRNEVRVDNLTPNPRLDDALFRFMPPAGTIVHDNTNLENGKNPLL